MEITIQIIDGKIKLCSKSGWVTELSQQELASLDRDIWAAMMELEEVQS